MHGQSGDRAQRAAARRHRVRHHRSTQERQRQERLLGIARMPDEGERQRDRRTDHRRDRRRQPGIAVAAPAQHQHHHDGGRHQQHAAEPVDLAAAVEHGDLAHLGQQQKQRADGERHVDPENHRPVQMLGEYAAEHGTHQACGHPDAAEIGLIPAALARADHVGDHGLHDRHDAAAAEPLQAARDDQYRHVRRHRAEDRADREQDQRNRNHDAAAVNVAQRAEHRRDRGRGQEIGRDDPGQVADVVELAADRRQRRRHDGLVERGQEHRQQQAHQDGANLVGAQRRRRRNRWRIADIDDLRRDARELAADIVRQCRLVGRFTALPLVLVHVRRNIVLRGQSRRDGIAISHVP